MYTDASYNYEYLFIFFFYSQDRTSSLFDSELLVNGATFNLSLSLRVLTDFILWHIGIVLFQSQPAF